MSSPRSIPPRPILKSSSRQSSTSSASSSSSKSPSSVQFSQCLSTTYLTHGSSDYNRSCIVVGPNDCKIPPRGCPGRTYGDEVAMQWTMDEDNFGTPSLIPDDGSSSEDSDSIPSTSYQSYIPPSVIAKSRSSSKRTSSSKPCASSYTYTPGYSIPRSAVAVSRSSSDSITTGRDEAWGCLGGF